MAARRSRSRGGMKMSKCHMWMIGAAFALFLFMWMGAGRSPASGATIGRYLEGFKEGKEEKSKEKDDASMKKLTEAIKGIDPEMVKKMTDPKMMTALTNMMKKQE